MPMPVNGATHEEAVASKSATQDLLHEVSQPQLPPPDQLSVEDVHVIVRSYREQIMQKSAELAGASMEIARRDKLIEQLREILNSK